MENRNKNSTVVSVEIINILVVTGRAKKPSRIIKEIHKNVSFVIIKVMDAIVKIIICWL